MQLFFQTKFIKQVSETNEDLRKCSKYGKKQPKLDFFITIKKQKGVNPIFKPC